MADHRVEDFLARNKEYSKTYKVPASVAELRAGPPPPHPGLAIISCIDGRLWPEDFFQFSKGEAPVIRTAGGRAMDAMRSLIILDAFIPLGTVMVIHHTDCGLTHITDEVIRKGLNEIAPDHSHEIDDMKFGEIKDLNATVKEDMGIIKTSPYFKNDIKVLGYVFDLAKGTLSEVTPE